jgi:hypothetical protein
MEKYELRLSLSCRKYAYSICTRCPLLVAGNWEAIQKVPLRATKWFSARANSGQERHGAEIYAIQYQWMWSPLL